jgi:hypothetical protein
VQPDPLFEDTGVYAYDGEADGFDRHPRPVPSVRWQARNLPWASAHAWNGRTPRQVADDLAQEHLRRWPWR